MSDAGALKQLWNIAGKAKDLDAEVRFFMACGASDVRRDVVKRADGQRDNFAIMMLGGERILLFHEPVYESSLRDGLHYGLTHAVFEVDDLDKVLTDFATKEVRPFWGPATVSGSFGRRRIAFVRSPSGFIIEVEQPLAA